jgi:CheY-like chemotaxis protein
MREGKTRILLAEDNVLGREMISSYIEDLGFSCATACNGIEAIGLVKQEQFDLIILDIEMPLLNGYLAAEEIRSMGLTVPILALTAHHSEEQKAKCLSVGMNGCLTKPFEKNALEQQIVLLTNNAGANETEKEPVVNDVPATGVINLAFLSRISKGRKDFFMSMIDIFIEQNNTDLFTLRNAIDIADFDSIRLLSHKIRTSVSFIGLEKQLQDPLQEMEHLGEQKRNAERVRNLYGNVVAVCAEAGKELELIRKKGQLI